MLKIFNDLSVFFEDNYRTIHVREYASLLKISPPTASKTLEEYYTEGLLKKEVDKGYHCFWANRESQEFRDLQRMYWKNRLEEFIKYIEETTYCQAIILFGSAAKNQLRKESDLDIVILTARKEKIDVKKFERKIGREIQLFTFTKFEDIPKNLQKAILNGYLLSGFW